MQWEPELAELNRRLADAQQMGGPEAVEKQHARGKLTVRERIALLADNGTFREFQTLLGGSRYDDCGQLVVFQKSGEVSGMADIDGRRVVLVGGDFTVRGGSGTAEQTGLGQELTAPERALRWRIPLVRLLDSAGTSVRGVENLGRSYLPDGNVFSVVDTELLGTVPVVSAVLGAVAGLPAVNVCMAHFSVMVEGMGQVFPGGPPVVKAALGYDIDKESLGGAEIHTSLTGVVDNRVPDEASAFAQIRGFLSYLPSSVDELPPVAEPADPPSDAGETLRTLVPRNRRHPYDADRLIRAVVDEGSFFPIAPSYGRGRTAGLARVNGQSVGIMANNPMIQAGSTGVTEGEKVIRLIKLCDTFHLPLITFADEPGFMVGVEAERQGIERAGARLICAVNDSRMPWLTVVVGRVFGVAGQCQHRTTGMFARYCWPSSRWGSMPFQGGVAAAYRAEIEAAPDPEAKRADIEARLDAMASPFRTAEATGQDIIDPVDTRSVVTRFVDDAPRILRTQLGPPPHPFRP